VVNLVSRAIGKGRRTLAARFGRRALRLASPFPIVSFTFDDAPRTAFTAGSAILRDHGARATYFVSLGLLDRHTELGLIGGRADLERAVESGHELGCHTFDHLDAWHTSSSRFIASVDANQEALGRCLPGQAFRTFAYPKSGARLGVKGQLERRFDCCRGGGQTFNAGVADLNQLSACFLDRYARVDMGFISELVERNARSRGWLIFAAHDISDGESPFGCSPGFFADVVRCAAESGARLIPVAEACDALHQPDVAEHRAS
jgi:hypothetical protein